MSLKSTSKFISLILRHKPEVIGITLDEHGWANVDELIQGVSRTRTLDMALLEEIVRPDGEGRVCVLALCKRRLTDKGCSGVTVQTPYGRLN